MNKYNEQLDDIDIIKDVCSAVSDTENLNLRQAILSIHEAKKKPKVVFLNHLRNKHIAAAIAGLTIIGGSLFTYYYSTTVANKKIYSEYFNPNIDLQYVRSDTSLKLNSTMVTGIKYFKNKEYSAALEIFKSDTESILAILYQGLCYMELDSFNKAEKSFNFILYENNNLFIDQAEWNLGLCYIRQNKIDLAIKIFSKIENSNGYYSKKAKDILSNYNHLNN